MPDGDPKLHPPIKAAAQGTSWVETISPPSAPAPRKLPPRRAGERTVQIAADAQGRVRIKDASLSGTLRSLYWGTRLSLLLSTVIALAFWHDQILRYIGQQMGRNVVPLGRGAAEGAAISAWDSTRSTAEAAWSALRSWVGY